MGVAAPRRPPARQAHGLSRATTNPLGWPGTPLPRGSATARHSLISAASLPPPIKSGVNSSGQSSTHDRRVKRRRCPIDPLRNTGSSACADDDGGGGWDKIVEDSMKIVDLSR